MVTRRTLGTLLHSADKEDVLRGFPYRMTHESIKRWPKASQMMIDSGYRLSIISDAEWLASTTFPVRKDGRTPNRQFSCNHDTTKFRTVMTNPSAMPWSCGDGTRFATKV